MDNLEKYWYYRNRLRTKFIFLSEDNELGSNIPVDRITRDANLLNGELILGDITSFVWDDCNGALPYYIILLATEYYLLKDNGQDVSETLKELDGAITTLERLDGLTGSNNGCFYRSDIEYIKDRNVEKPSIGHENVFKHFDNVAGKTVNLRFSEMLPSGRPRTNSIDNIIKFIEAEAVVRKYLLSNGGKATKLSKRLTHQVRLMLSNAYHPNTSRSLFNRNKLSKNGILTWYLEDPNGNLIPAENGGGADLYTIATSYGLSMASERFGLNCKSIPGGKALFKLITKLNKKVINKSFWFIRSLIAICNIDLFDGKIYEFLKEAETKYDKKLEQYVLLNAILRFGRVSDRDLNEIKALLDFVPEDGIYNYIYKDGDRFNYHWIAYEWSSPNRFVWPELRDVRGTNKDGWKRHGEFNGIDFMVLHNLYWIASVKRGFCVK